MAGGPFLAAELVPREEWRERGQGVRDLPAEGVSMAKVRFPIDYYLASSLFGFLPME